MTVYLYTFLPALLVVAIIRIDAMLIGTYFSSRKLSPYFSAGELLPNFRGRDAPSFYTKGTLRFALVRRLTYPVIMGLVYAIVGSDVTLALLGGLMTGFLLVWPAWIAPNPPEGVSTRDAFYHIFYLLVLLSAGALTLFGFYLADVGSYLMEVYLYLSEGDPLRYLANILFMALTALVLSIVFPAGTSGVGKNLTEKARRRIQDHE